MGTATTIKQSQRFRGGLENCRCPVILCERENAFPKNQAYYLS